MYVRINQVKFPNKMAKQAVQKHTQSTLSKFGENGRLMRLTVDVSEIKSFSNIYMGRQRETYKKFGFDEMNKFNQMEKEMGAVVSYSEGEALGEISKIFDKSLFEEK